MTKTEQKILEEFEKEFGGRLATLEKFYQIHGGDSWKGERTIPMFILKALAQVREDTIEEVKDFIAKTLKDNNEKIIDELTQESYNEFLHDNPYNESVTKSTIYMDGYYKAIDKAIEIVRSE